MKLNEAEALRRAAELNKPKLKYKNAGKLKGKVDKNGQKAMGRHTLVDARDKLAQIPTGLPPVREKKQPAPRGRPSGYKPEFAEIAKKAMALGATRHDLAEILQIDQNTVYRWTLQHEDFGRALKVGAEMADDRVEASLYRKAVGFEFDSEKVAFGKDGEVLRAKTREVVHPDTGSAIFWLKNRRPDQWRERQENLNTNITIEMQYEQYVREIQNRRLEERRGGQIEALDDMPMLRDAAE